MNALLIVAVGALYGAVLANQGNGPAYWFVTVLLVAVACASVAAASGNPALMLVNLVILGACTILGILSIGLLFVPAFGFGITSYVIGREAHRP